MFVGTNAMSVRGGRSVAAAVSAMTAITAAMAVMTTTTTPSTGAVTLDSVAVRLGLPEGRGLSGVCLFRSGPDKRRRVMFKSVASARKKYGGGGGDYMVAGDLAADRVYEGTFSRLVDGDQVARFGCDGGRRFEVATPFVVPESDLDTILAVKESMERRFGAQPSRRDPQRSVTAEHVSVTLRGLRPSFAETGMDAAAAAITVDVFQLYKKPPPPTRGRERPLGRGRETSGRRPVLGLPVRQVRAPVPGQRSRAGRPAARPDDGRQDTSLGSRRSRAATEDRRARQPNRKRYFHIHRWPLSPRHCQPDGHVGRTQRRRRWDVRRRGRRGRCGHLVPNRRQASSQRFVRYTQKHREMLHRWYGLQRISMSKF
ncbi:unnamed protein product [Aphis gossypii]|uniref:Uncharacterized protein n=1 Tax=Aphis gossypii TaxID=80765 RepID=A0A9P0J6Q4_APHGO|nr:unnamed protein product [Aphis gossypii]